MEQNKRTLCPRCTRPTPRGCICEGIPEERIALNRTQVIVLQHPNELRHKNRSLPLLELSLRPTDLHVIHLRRLGEQVDKELMAQMNDATHPLILMYPGNDSITLQEGIDRVRENYPPHCKINLFVLDATWKYAREMDMANQREKQYPTHMIRIALSTKDFPATFSPRRFDIRTPPSIDHLSTAESVAWVLTKFENNPNLYDTLMKPLDAMVQKWSSFSDTRSAKDTMNEEEPSYQEQLRTKPGSKKRKHVRMER